MIEGRNKYRSGYWGGRACDGNAESLMFSFGCPYFYAHRTIPYLQSLRVGDVRCS